MIDMKSCAEDKTAGPCDVIKYSKLHNLEMTVSPLHLQIHYICMYICVHSQSVIGQLIMS